MPRAYQGTFEKSRHRWTMMVDGQRHRVKCSDLNLPESHWTKELSYQAAKEWLDAKLNNDPSALSQVIESTVTIPLDRLKAMIEQGQAAQAILDADGDVDDLIVRVDGLVEGVLVEHWDDAHRIDILGRIGEKVGTTAPHDYHLERNASRFLELERAKGKKPRTYGELSESIATIINATYKGQSLLHPNMDVRHINKNTVADFYLMLRNEGREPGQQKKQFGFFKRLVKHLFAEELIDMPRNLANRWDFNIHAKKIKEYDRGEVIALLGRLAPRLKCYALLGLNCGMLAVDISSLKKEEIDWKQGRIKRKRTKTEDEEDVPVVDYKLWPITTELLKQCLSDDPVLAFTTMNGTSLVTCRIEGKGNGKEKRKNAVRDQWKRAKTKIPHKAFRSIGATVIGAKADDGMVAYYLGHSPQSMLNRHYKAPDREQFDSVVTWMGQQFQMA